MKSLNKMKKLIYLFLILINLSSYGQEVFEYEFDENISLNILEETEEGALSNGKFIKGTFENEVFSCFSSDIIKLKTTDETYLLKLFQGFKEGTLKSTKGTLISEEIINIENIKVAKSKISFTLESKNKIVESYILAYKNIIYTFQFMNDEEEFEKFNNFRKNIIDSIKFK